MSFSAANLLPLAAQLGGYVTSAVQQYGDLRSAGMEVTADTLAAFVEMQTAAWHPKIGGVELLSDSATRTAGCRFIAGIAYKIAGGS